MNTLQQLRADLADVMRDAGFSASFDHVPDNFEPPFAAVDYAEPYLSGEPPVRFGTYEVKFEVFIVVERGDNELEASALDTAIVKTVAALRASRMFHVSRVDRPVVFEAKTGAEYPATFISVTAGDIELKEEA